MSEYHLKRCHFTADEIEYLLKLVEEHARVYRRSPDNLGFMQTILPLNDQVYERLQSYARKECDA